MEELFALVSLDNSRGAATAQRIGMERIGETEQHHQKRLSLYRLRHSDLSYSESGDDEAPDRAEIGRSDPMIAVGADALGVNREGAVASGNSRDLIDLPSPN